MSISPKTVLAGKWATGAGVVHLILAFGLAGLGVTLMIVANAQGGDWQAVGKLAGMGALAVAGFLFATGVALVLAGRRVRTGSNAARIVAQVVAVVAAAMPVFLLVWIASGNSPGLDVIIMTITALAAWVIPHGVLVMLLSSARDADPR